MPLQSRPYTFAKFSDAILGVFSCFPESEQLNHTVRYLSTWSGSDKLFMVVQYLAKLIIPVLELRARLQYRAGFRSEPKSIAAQKWAKIASVIGDSRTLWRIWGLLPIIQWMISLERIPPPTKYLQTIERLQGLSMLIYYPLEHVYYLASHSVLPLHWTPSPSMNEKIAVWSCRAWAVYVVLQFLHLKEDWKLLKFRERALKRSSGKGPEDPSLPGEHADVAQRKSAILNELLVNVGYLPLTLHWSLEGGLFSNDVSQFSLIFLVTTYSILSCVILIPFLNHAFILLPWSLLMSHCSMFWILFVPYIVLFLAHGAMGEIFHTLAKHFAMFAVPQMWVGVFGTMAALGSFRGGWTATALV